MTTFPLCSPIATDLAPLPDDPSSPPNIDSAVPPAGQPPAEGSPDQTPVVYVVDDDLAVLDAMTLLSTQRGLKAPRIFFGAGFFGCVHPRPCGVFGLGYSDARHGRHGAARATTGN